MLVNTQFLPIQQAVSTFENTILKILFFVSTFLDRYMPEIIISSYAVNITINMALTLSSFLHILMVNKAKEGKPYAEYSTHF